MNLTRSTFGTTPEGTEVSLYKLKNSREFEVEITNYGGAITSIKTPDRSGRFSDIVLGYETLDAYVTNPRFLGALIGRHANRIAHGKFSLNGKGYQLAQNNGINHLHGGWKGYDKVVWSAQAEEKSNELALHLTYLSNDGEEHYPGNLSVAVDYFVTNENEVRINYQATTDQDTIVNLTNHSYFNLAGYGDILEHELMINADSFTPVSKDLIPTGEIRAVAGTAMDFTTARSIGSRINSGYEQLGFTGGYDHNYVLNGPTAEIRLAARAKDPSSGRIMEVWTTQPGLQFYSGNFLDGSLTGKQGVSYQKYAGFCLETQHFPDTPNHAKFPNTVLKVGEIYEEKTVLKFLVD